MSHVNVAEVNRRSRGWCWTWNNPPIPGAELLETLKCTEGSDYMVFQLETGESGTPHFQGYIRFKDARRRATVSKLLPGANIRAADGTPAQNRAYCTKDEGRLEGPWESGRKPKTQGQRTDLDEAIRSISEIGYKRAALEHPATFARYPSGLRNIAQLMDESSSVGSFQPKRVILCFGATRTGKSRYARSLKEQTSDGKAYLHTNSDWFDGYHGQELAIFDDFGAGHKVRLDTLLKLTDCYDDWPVPVKGSFQRWYPQTIVFTSNTHPWYWYEWEDRKELQYAMAARFNEVRLFVKGLDVQILSDPDVILEFFLNPGIYSIVRPE